MDEVDRLGMIRMFARKMVGLRDTVNGLMVLQGKPVLTDGELIEVARGALDLIEEGKV